MKKSCFFILLLPGLLYAKTSCTNDEALHRLSPQGEWTMQNDDPATLHWMSRWHFKPSKKSIEKARQNCIAEKLVQEKTVEHLKAVVQDKTQPDSERLNALITLLGYDQ